MLFECGFSVGLLHRCGLWLYLTHVPHKFQRLKHWIIHLTKRKTWKSQIWSAAFTAVIYHVWAERNARRHTGPKLGEEHRF